MSHGNAAAPALIAVRLASAADAEMLAELGALAFTQAFGPDNTHENMDVYLTQAFSPQIQAAELADPLSRFLVAESAGQTVGYARMREGAAPDTIRGGDPIEIVRFYARPGWVGRGVGAALMQACLEQARARGKLTLWLDVWERNLRARAFYARWGFREVGTQPFRLGADVQTDVLMERPVPPDEKDVLEGSPPH